MINDEPRLRSARIVPTHICAICPFCGCVHPCIEVHEDNTGTIFSANNEEKFLRCDDCDNQFEIPPLTVFSR